MHPSDSPPPQPDAIRTKADQDLKADQNLARQLRIAALVTLTIFAFLFVALVIIAREARMQRLLNEANKSIDEANGRIERALDIAEKAIEERNEWIKRAAEATIELQRQRKEETEAESIYKPNLI